MKHGPFWLGGYGLFANIVLLGWTLFTLIMYSLPYTIPVRFDNMNYVSVVYAAVCGIIAIDWHTRGKREYLSQRHGTEIEASRAHSYTPLPRG